MALSVNTSHALVTIEQKKDLVIIYSSYRADKGSVGQTLFIADLVPLYYETDFPLLPLGRFSECYERKTTSIDPSYMLKGLNYV